MANTVDKVLKIAQEEVGYLEKSATNYKKYGKSCLYHKKEYAGQDNYTKYGYEMHQIYPSVMDFPAAWCDTFVDWCFYKAYGISTAKAMLGGNFDDYTKNSVNLYVKKEAFIYAKSRSASTEPRMGDQIFFSRDGTYKGIYHTGIVTKVTDNYVYTIEGNTSNGSDVVPNGGGVYAKSYAKIHDKIYGYGRPKYDAQPEIKETYPKWIKSGEDWYYRIAEGENAHGWKLINHRWYYFDDKGKMLTGIVSLGDETFYLNEMKDNTEGACCKTNNRGALVEWYVD